MTFNEILRRMLGRVSNTFDKREGSIIYDTLAPSAVEFENMHSVVQKAKDNTFFGTAEREWLIKQCANIGLTPFPATHAIRKGVFTPSTLEISIGERFSYETVNFIVTEKIEDGVYKLECEELGEVGNLGEGRLIPIEYIQGLETATLAEVLIYGEDEEATEDLRLRYAQSFPLNTVDGNKAYYEKLCREYEGIGNFKLFSCWNGVNTLKVSILSSNNTLASDELIDNFQEYLDPHEEPIDDDLEAESYPQGRGMGDGAAVIGCIVTVSTATEKPIDIVASVIYKNGYSQPVNLRENIEDYLLALNYDKSIVSYVAISALFAADPAIDLVVDVTINGGKNNITLGEEEISKLGTLSVTGE